MALAARRAAPAAQPPAAPQWSGYADVSELDRYKLVSNIGKGSFGVISKVQRVDDGREFAMKQLDYSKMTEKDRKQILAEVAILEGLKHRNIVQLVQKIKDVKNERIYIVMEYCTSGDLGSLIRKAQRSGQPLHEDKIWNIFLQITLALHHCHWPESRSSAKNGRLSGANGNGSGEGSSTGRYQVLHRDLKPENVFLSDEFVKLGDFGLSKDMGTAAFTSTYVGTPLYMPPEILAENRYDTKSDIWSLGCLVFEMCALTSPFSTAQTQAELIQMVKSGRLPPLPSHISLALKGVIRAMLTLNPVKRPSTRDLLEMDEMKLHRKLFTVQNQTSLLMARKEELKRFEESLLARSASLDERQRAIEARDASLQARESIVVNREEEAKETQKRLNFAAETLRGQWDKLREEKERDRLGMGLPKPDERVRRASAVSTRPALEERNSLPTPSVSRLSRPPQPAYEDTPSKLPSTVFASAAITTGPGRAPTPLRRNATKSLGNLGAAARGQAERDAACSGTEATPAKKTVISFPRHGRTSIGSPSELRGGAYCEDVSMASPSVGSPWIPRPRRSSVIAAVLQPSSSASAQESSNSTETSSISVSDQAKAISIPPTMIPAPTFIYREAATPAKWSLEDPDLPSPFLRRFPSAPANTATAATSERAVLGAINPQQVPQHSAPPLQSYATAPPFGLKKAHQHQHQPQQMQTQMPIPRSRSKSGGLHAQVLRSNATAAAKEAQGQGQGQGQVQAIGSHSTERRTSGDGSGGGMSGARARAAIVNREAARMMTA